jgi:hypothetical protein
MHLPGAGVPTLYSGHLLLGAPTRRVKRLAPTQTSARDWERDLEKKRQEENQPEQKQVGRGPAVAAVGCVLRGCWWLSSCWSWAVAWCHIQQEQLQLPLAHRSQQPRQPHGSSALSCRKRRYISGEVPAAATTIAAQAQPSPHPNPKSTTSDPPLPKDRRPRSRPPSPIPIPVTHLRFSFSRNFKLNLQRGPMPDAS